ELLRLTDALATGDPLTEEQAAALRDAANATAGSAESAESAASAAASDLSAVTAQFTPSAPLITHPSSMLSLLRGFAWYEGGLIGTMDRLQAAFADLIGGTAALPGELQC
ncbi:hypothetical protein, partial [Leucobacter sp. M11]|uniref:hypothetical protein n=1 Tax=Leucobacter sp. M11 TaxID=2993565 RepID=UPI002D7F4FA2